MTIHTLHANGVAPQAWRNGGGQTRELLAWPTATDWTLRISRADIATDGPFSEFAGVQRWFVVLEDAGVQLQFAHDTQTLRAGDAPLQFAGASAPHCALLSGPTQDLNLMARGGRSTLQAVQAEAAWDAQFAVRGVYTVTGGVWRCGVDTRVLPAHTLLWCDTGHDLPWTFAPQHMASAAHVSVGAVTPTHAWWLGFTPEAHA